MSSAPDRPALVSIGIPTFNRAALLDRAIGSVLGQSYGAIEVVISDNASSDDTAQVCARWQARDARLRVLRQPENRGPTANFAAVLAAAGGDYFMWLSDDDWLDANYVEECLRPLAQHDGVSLVAGRCLHYDEQGRQIREDAATQLRQPAPAARVLSYFAAVAYNSVFYGLMPTTLVREVGMQNVLANDWIVIANAALQGTVLTTERTRVHRTMGGTSMSVQNVVRVSRLPRWQLLLPEVVIACNCARAVRRLRWAPAADGWTRWRTSALVLFIVLLRRSWFRRLVPRRLRTRILARFTQADALPADLAADLRRPS